MHPAPKAAGWGRVYLLAVTLRLANVSLPGLDTATARLGFGNVHLV